MKATIFALVIIVLAAVVATVASSPPDPRNVADADRTRVLMQQEAAMQAQKREQDAKLFTIQEAERIQVSQQVVASVSVALRFITLAVAIVAIGWGAGLGYAGIQVGRAIGQLAMLRANLFPVNPNTGQLPMYRNWDNGSHTLTNGNDNSVLDVTRPREANREKLITAGQTQHDGVVSRNQRTRPLLGLGMPRKSLEEGIAVQLDNKYAEVLNGKQR